jgi:hypothetical protein
MPHYICIYMYMYVYIHVHIYMNIYIYRIDVPVRSSKGLWVDQVKGGSAVLIFSKRVRFGGLDGED